MLVISQRCQFKIAVILLVVMLGVSTFFAAQAYLPTENNTNNIDTVSYKRGYEIPCYISGEKTKLNVNETGVFQVVINSTEGLNNILGPITSNWNISPSKGVTLTVNEANMALVTFTEATEEPYTLTCSITSKDGGYGFAALTVYDPPTFPTQYIGVNAAPYSYLIKADGTGWYYAVNGSTGAVVFTSTNAATVAQYAYDNLPINGGVDFIGNFTILAQINGTSHSVTNLHNSVFTKSGSTGSMFCFNGKTDFTVIGGVLDGNATQRTTDAFGLLIMDSSNATIRDVEVKNTGYSGIAIGWRSPSNVTYSSSNIDMYNINCHDTFRNGLTIAYSNNIKVDGANLYNNSENGFTNYGSNSSIFENFLCYDNYYFGAESLGDGTLSYTASENIYNNMRFENNGYYGCKFGIAGGGMSDENNTYTNLVGINNGWSLSSATPSRGVEIIGKNLLVNNLKGSQNDIGVRLNVNNSDVSLVSGINNSQEGIVIVGSHNNFMALTAIDNPKYGIDATGSYNNFVGANIERNVLFGAKIGRSDHTDVGNTISNFNINLNGILPTNTSIVALQLTGNDFTVSNIILKDNMGYGMHCKLYNSTLTNIHASTNQLGAIVFSSAKDCILTTAIVHNNGLYLANNWDGIYLLDTNGTTISNSQITDSGATQRAAVKEGGSSNYNYITDCRIGGSVGLNFQLTGANSTAINNFINNVFYATYP